MKFSRHPSRVNQTFVFFFARIFFNVHLLHNRQLFHSSSCRHFVLFSEAVTVRWIEETRVLSDCISNSINFYMVSLIKKKFYYFPVTTFLIHSEILEFDNHWQHVRGSALIISMKAISLAFDISSTKIPRLPRLDEYLGYALCPANIVLGPFVTFSSYKSCHRQSKLSFKLVMQIFLSSLLSLCFIVMSSCFLNFLISDHLPYIVTYRDALIFRCSHYFISFMSSATLLVSGIDSRMTSDLLGYQVTRPFDIELPRSLIPVVISWNIPIHMWVKTCKSSLSFILMSRRLIFLSQTFSTISSNSEISKRFF